MRSNSQKIAYEMLKQRRRAGLSQAEAARRARVSPSYLCQVETGVRHASLRLAQALEGVYGLRSGHLVKRYKFPGRGRKRFDPGVAAALRDLFKAVSLDAPARLPSPVPVPPRPWKDCRGTLDNPLWPIALHLGREAQEEVELLECRQKNDHYWRLFNSLPFDSWTEKRFMVKLGLAGGSLVRIAPARLGVAVNVVDAHGVNTRQRPQVAMLVRHQGVAVALWPQRPVHASTLWKLDALAVVAWQGKRMTINIEIDNPATHNRERDRYRDWDVGVPTLRYEADMVNAGGFLKRFFADIRQLVEQHRA